jgi:DNA-binding SARP family transcriptional activator/Flp pilus assembly protein TadD
VGWEFRILGSLEVIHDGVVVPVPAAKQRVLLASLLIDANRVVPVDTLVARLWGPTPPTSGRATLQNYIMRLRRGLGDTIADNPVVTRPDGYQIVLAEGGLDAHRFESLVRQAEATPQPQQAATLLRAALALWRGDALADVPSELLQREAAAKLAEQRVAAIELRIDADLRLDRHPDLIGELRALVAQHPLRERFWMQLMRALYRVGRQADALDAYRTVAQLLADDLGIDPNPELRQLHQRILVNDPALSERERVEVAAPPPAVPRQLPAPPRSFAGRTQELALLCKLMDAQDDPAGSVVISAIGGAGGIGKSWLALRWAHDNLDRFPDGQLYSNLRGFDPGGEPAAPTVVLHSFLEALGVEPGAIPAEPDAQIGLYRSITADRRLLVLLDNVQDSNQVLPLLPGGRTCTVLITSRHQLGGLVTAHGARSVPLGVLDDTEAHQLLAHHVGPERPAAEPAATAELLTYCAGLPLALGIVAARATARPDFPLALLAEELRVASTRLDALDAGELAANLRAVFAASYHAVSAPAARAFTLIGLVPGPDLGLPAVAGLTGRPRAEVRALLRELEAVHLVSQHVPGRYRMHDLIRLYAAERSQRDQAAGERALALRRLVDHYVHTARTGDRLLDPFRDQFDFGQPAPGCVPEQLADESAALAWFDAEHGPLLAAQQVAAERGWHASVWHLAWATSTFHWRRGHLHDQVVAWLAGVAAADRLADPISKSIALRHLGRAHVQTGALADGLADVQQALVLADQAGDALNEAHTHFVAAGVWHQRREYAQALTHALHALRLHQTLGSSVYEAETDNAVGWLYAQLGDFDSARTHCERALVLSREYDYPIQEAHTLDSLGYIAHRTGRHADAVAHYRAACELYQAVGASYAEGIALDRLGEIEAELGRPEARADLQRALDLYRSQRRPEDARRVEDLLAGLSG